MCGRSFQLYGHLTTYADVTNLKLQRAEQIRRVPECERLNSHGWHRCSTHKPRSTSPANFKRLDLSGSDNVRLRLAEAVDHLIGNL